MGQNEILLDKFIEFQSSFARLDERCMLEFSRIKEDSVDFNKKIDALKAVVKNGNGEASHHERIKSLESESLKDRNEWRIFYTQWVKLSPTLIKVQTERKFAGRIIKALAVMGVISLLTTVGKFLWAFAMS